MNADAHANGNGVTLSRTLGLFDVTMIGIGAMIGAGIFVLTGIAAGHAGPALTLGFLLNGIMTTFTALSYAELGSCFPVAGGGYQWVKEGLGRTQGFLAGWMTWFAQSVACALYGLGFGRFAIELWHLADLPFFIPEYQMALGFTVIIVALFAYINFRGASEAGLVGNVVTIAKLVLLGIFIAFGLYVMFRNPNWGETFTNDFFANGLGGVFVAMGLTFIAFEGYDIIAQSGEEVKNPEYNIPRAIIFSLVVVITFYLLVAFVALGAVTPPEGLFVWDYLAQAKEIAIVRAAEQIMPYGGIAILIGGLASTMSALNATLFSSSRVSFAMGRDNDLPAAFGRIHPHTRTPHLAVAISASLIIVMALSLPIEEVAAATSTMFLVMFTQVNIALMTLRRRRPDLKRTFKVPFFPWPAIIGIVANLALAIFLSIQVGRVGFITLGWIGVGLLLYWGYFKDKEALERPKEVLHEEALVSVDYSVLLPVSDEQQASVLGRIGCVLGKEQNGEVLALHVIKVPPHLTLSDGRIFLREGRPYIDQVIEQGRERDVPVHTMIRLGRSISEAILKTTAENASDLLLLGWPGYTGSRDRLFGSVIDPIISNPPTDIGIVRYRPFDELKRILVPVAGGPNGRLALSMAIALARNTEEETQVVLLHVALPNVDPRSAEALAHSAFRRAAEGLSFDFEQSIVRADSPAKGILKASEDCDMVVIGATKEPLFRNLLLGNVSQQVAEAAKCPVIIVKRRSNVLASMLRETVLQPVRKSSKLPAAELEPEH